MENVKPSAKKFILNYGLILGTLSVLLGATMYATNNHLAPHWSFSLVGFIIIIGIIIYGVHSYKKENNGYLTIGEALKIGIGIALIGGIIGGIWSLLLANVIEPDYMEKAIELQREKTLESFPDMTEEQLEQGLELSRKLSSPVITFAIGIIGNLFLGFVISLIGGAVMQKKEYIQ